MGKWNLVKGRRGGAAIGTWMEPTKGTLAAVAGNNRGMK